VFFTWRHSRPPWTNGKNLSHIFHLSNRDLVRSQKIDPEAAAQAGVK
jgi:hypothetical protein